MLIWSQQQKCKAQSSQTKCNCEDILSSEKIYIDMQLPSDFDG